MKNSAGTTDPWQVLVSNANVHLSAGRLEQALRVYDQAARAIGDLLDAGPIDLSLIITKLVVQQNRAGALAQLGRFREAYAAYRAGHAFAEAIIDDELMPQNLQQAARGHARAIIAAWQGCTAADHHRPPDPDGGRMRTSQPLVNSAVTAGEPVIVH